jgi:GAF domain-containing protein
MNKNKKQFGIGLGAFIFLIIGILIKVYLFGGTNILFYVAVAASISASLVLLYELHQSKISISHLEADIQTLKEERENAQLTKQNIVKDEVKQIKVLKIDDRLAHILQVDKLNTSKIDIYAEKILQNIAKELSIVQGLVFAFNKAEQLYAVVGQYAYYSENTPASFSIGDGLSGQVAKSQQTLVLTDLPDGYVTVLSASGRSNPRQLVIAPIVYDNNCIGIMEIASFNTFGKNELELVGKICEAMAKKFNELEIEV